jgi:hypothetical protein
MRSEEAARAALATARQRGREAGRGESRARTLGSGMLRRSSPGGGCRSAGGSCTPQRESVALRRGASASSSGADRRPWAGAAWLSHLPRDAACPIITG